MRLSDDFDDRNSGIPLLYMMVGVLLFVVTVIGAVVMANRRSEEHTSELQSHLT